MAGRRASKRTHGVEKPHGVTQLDALEAVRGPIVQMRAAGLSVQVIAARLAKRHGVKVNRNAVHRFCEKHAIPLGVKPPEAPPRSPPAYHAFPVEGTLDEVSTAKTPDTSKSRGGERDVRARQNAPTSAPPSHAPGLSTDERAVASLLAEMRPFAERIEAARQSGDRVRIYAAVQDSLVWLISCKSRTAEFLRGHVESAIEQTRAILREYEPGADHGAQPGTVSGMPTTLGATTSPSTVPSQTPPIAPPSYTPLPRAPVWTPDLPLIFFNDQGDQWTLQDACEGTLVLGATGSGKTSGSGSTIARAFLDAHFGGLVLTAKQDECALWQKHARATGRSEQLCIFKPGGEHRFNFLDYQARLPDDRGGSTENVVELFYTIMAGFSRGAGMGIEGGSFWADAAKQLFRNTVRLIRAAKLTLSLSTMRAIICQAPQSLDEARAGSWQMTPTFGPLMRQVNTMVERDPGNLALAEAQRYWLVDFPSIHTKTRTIIVTSFTAMVDLFFDPTLAELFQRDTTLTPDAVFDGAIIVVELPIERWLAIGTMAQLIWKYFMQLAVRRRSDADDASRRPVFLWIDEFQSLMSDGDALFQATARSARCASVFLTQNLPGLYAQAGPMLPHERVESLVGNLATKIFHANSDPTTNTWAAVQLGKTTQYRSSVSSAEPVPVHKRTLRDLIFQRGDDSRTTTNPIVDFTVQPSAFTTLRTGSERYDRLVEAYVLKNGARFSNGKQHLKAVFQQE